MSNEVQLEREVELQVIALRAKERDCQTLTINLLKPESLIKPEEMSRLAMPLELDWQKGIILYGRAPIWLYGHLVDRFQDFPWVGCYDIRSKTAIVVKSNVPELEPGDTIPIFSNNVPGAAILVGGPPNSGKSVLCNALGFRVLAKTQGVQVYLHRANWDGEGNHTYETSDRDLAEKLRQKNKFKPHQHPQAEELIKKYFNYHAQATSNIREMVDLALVDVGGVPDPVKSSVVEQCSHYIVISNDPDKVQAWHDLCGKSLKPIAVIHSVLEERLEVIRTEPFLEILAGPWLRDEVRPVPEELLKEVLKLLS